MGDGSVPATAPPAIAVAAPGYIFTYSTEHLAKKDKVRFFYALKGRDGKPGIVQRAAIEHLGRTVLLAPEKTSPDVEQFLVGWGCVFAKRRVLLP